MRILALFDDGNGSVKKALPDHDVVSVGIGTADIVMDLSDLKNIKKLVDMHKKDPFDLLMNRAKFAFNAWKGSRHIVRSSIPVDLIKDIVSYFE